MRQSSRSTLPLNSLFGDLINKIKFRKYSATEQYLKDSPEQFYDFVDEMHKTLLHWAWEKNVIQIVKLIIDTLFEKGKMLPRAKRIIGEVNLQQYVNKQNYDGLTALHYASFRGNIEIIEYLCSLGADPFIKDSDGHNVIHIAAQGDKVNAIYYYINNYEFDINDVDCRNSSALHWAAYLNKEIALSYLIAWGADVNWQDKELNSPLHLAVLTAEQVRETRCVKILLLKGADRSLKNKDGNIPAKLIKDGEMTQELKSILKKPSYCSWMMLKVPLTKINKNYYTLIFFLFLFILLKGGSALLLLPMVDTEYRNYVGYFSASLTGLVLLIFLIATCKNPGYLKTDDSIDFQELLNVTDPYNLCPEWKIIRTPRSRHCNICNKCVER